MKKIQPKFYSIKKIICKIFGHNMIYYRPWFDGEYFECKRCWKNITIKKEKYERKNI